MRTGLNHSGHSVQTLTKLPWYIAVGFTLVVLSGCHQHATKLSEAEIAEQDRQRVSYLLDEVSHGDKSFESAGCDYRAGEWDDDRSICIREFMIPRSDGETTQDAVLASRIEILAGLSNDPDGAESEAETAEQSWLDDHPRDYRGAVSHAIAAVRKHGLLTGLSQIKTQQLPQLTDGSFTKFIDLNRIP